MYGSSSYSNIMGICESISVCLGNDLDMFGRPAYSDIVATSENASTFLGIHVCVEMWSLMV